MNDIGFVCAAILFGIIAIGFAIIPTIHEWERANDYPYGKMCNSAFTFYVDTCPKGGR